jgi:ubiquinone/menaquinone biosynthesis C-methylase UbiE
VDGICDLLPEATRRESSAQAILLRRYSDNFSQRRDRAWLQPIRFCATSLSNGFLYRWAARGVEQFAGGRALSLLDAACGDGGLRYYLSPRHAYIGLDFSSRVLARAYRYHPGSYFRGDLNRLPFPDNSFEALVSLQSLSYLERPETGLAEMARVLKPESQLLLTLPNHQSFKYRRRGIPQIHVQHLNPSTIEALISRRFEIHQFESRGIWVPVPKIPLHLGLKAPPTCAIAFTIIASPKK